MVQTWWPVEASPKLLAVEEVVKCKWRRSRFGRGKRNIFINLGLLFTPHILKGIQVRSLCKPVNNVHFGLQVVVFHKEQFLLEIFFQNLCMYSFCSKFFPS